MSGVGIENEAESALGAGAGHVEYSGLEGDAAFCLARRDRHDDLLPPPIPPLPPGCLLAAPSAPRRFALRGAALVPQRASPLPEAMRRWWPLLVLLLMGMTWGLQFTMLKLAVERGRAEFNVVLMALVLISAVYTLLVVLRGRTFRPTREHVVFFAVIGVLGYILPMGATLYAAPHMPAGIITLFASLSPIATFAVAIGLRTEPVSRIRIGAMLLGCVSALLVLAPQLELPGRGALVWMLLVLVVPVCYGVESIYVAARWPKGLGVLELGLGEALVAAVLTLPLFLLFGEPRAFGLGVSVADLAILVFVLCGIFEVLMYFWLIRTTGGVLVSFGTFVSLFAGIGWGMVIFSERHGPSVWLAVLVLVAGLALVCLDTARGVRQEER